MSYVMQNFYYVNPILILNYRSRVAWLLRNVYLIVMLIVKTFNAYLFTNHLQTNYELMHKLSLLFYSKGFISVLQTTHKKWKNFMTLASTKSLKHTLYTTGTAFVDHKVIKLVEPNVKHSTQSLLFNQYLLPLSISNISLHNKPFRNVLFRALIMILTNWQTWNKHFRLTLRFLIGSPSLYMLYFYNMYLFKVYNL